MGNFYTKLQRGANPKKPKKQKQKNKTWHRRSKIRGGRRNELKTYETDSKIN
jgi:hypothetical protein